MHVCGNMEKNFELHNFQLDVLPHYWMIHTVDMCT